MDISRPMPLLGGLSPQTFMRRHWQKKPLLIRAALASDATDAMLIDRSQLFALAAREEVESRLVQHTRGQWSLRHGPFVRRSLPALPPAG